MINYLLVAIGGAIGALMRYGVGKGVDQIGIGTPAGTLFTNFTGSFILGLLLFSSERSGFLGERWKLFLAIGILGAYTTMSTFSFESVKLLEDKGFWTFLIYVGGTLLLVLLAIGLGKAGSYVLVK